MTSPQRPVFLIEGPASACVLGGKALGWLNCTPLSTAMGIDRSTLGKVRISGCQVRDEIEPPDLIGGTTMSQCVAVAARHGVKVEQHTGPNVCTPVYAATQLQAGRGFILQGNTEAIGKSNTNHAIWVNHAGRGTIGYPGSAMVYDPWSTGPAVWGWSKVLAFAAALHPYGEADRRRLGSGKFYCGIFPDTEPHAHFTHGGAKTSPFPHPMVVHSPIAGRRVRVRTGPGTAYPDAVANGKKLSLPSGAPWTAYQQASGNVPRGASSKLWYGNHDGSLWIHSSGLR